MLNGIDPIIIFNFKTKQIRLNPDTPIPLVPSDDVTIDLPAIPIYLSEAITGVIIDSEDKHVDIDTTTVAAVTGDKTTYTQRPIGSNVTINMTASKNSIGVTLFSALSDLIIPKLASKEYSITYLHGAITVFQGLLSAFSITQNTNDDRYNIVMTLVKPAVAKAGAVDVRPPTNPVMLAS